MAGAAAELRYARGPSWFVPYAELETANTGGTTDRRLALDAIADVADPAAALSLLWQCTRLLVDNNWDPILRVARHLQERGSLTGAEVAALVRQPLAVDSARYPEWRQPVVRGAKR